MIQYHIMSSITLLYEEINPDYEKYLIYDENEFLNGSNIIFFENKTIFDIVSLHWTLVNKNDNIYKYDIIIQEETDFGHFVAYGQVEIKFIDTYIDEVIVNNIKNGKLHDKYGDCFDLDVLDYIHILTHKKYNN